MDKYYGMEITKILNGGYLVSDACLRLGDAKQFLLASTTIDEALAFVKKKLEGEHPA